MAAMFFRIVAEDHFTLCRRVLQQSRVAPCGKRVFQSAISRGGSTTFRDVPRNAVDVEAHRKATRLITLIRTPASLM
jgi:hypothetical protein